MSQPTYPSTFPARAQSLLTHLHALSSQQESSLDKSVFAPMRAGHLRNTSADTATLDAAVRDKYIALDADKALLVYNLVLSSRASSIVEIGTSYGVSTIYLALGAVENARAHGGTARVIATEKEEGKAEGARANWMEAGSEIESVIELRVGDLLETLKDGVGEVDFVLLDIWPYVALPALELLLPSLKPGAVIVTDNVISSAKGYAGLLRVLRDPDGLFESVTLPYTGGIEFSVRNSKPSN